MVREEEKKKMGEREEDARRSGREIKEGGEGKMLLRKEGRERSRMRKVWMSKRGNRI